MKFGEEFVHLQAWVKKVLKAEDSPESALATKKTPNKKEFFHVRLC